MVYPPIAADAEDGRFWYSVDVVLPPDADATLRSHVEQDASSSWTIAIHGALYRYRATLWSPEALRAELMHRIQEGLDDVEAGRTVEATPEFWENLHHRARENLARMATLRAQGRLGNLLLPRELWQFIHDEIAAGRSKTPSEIVCAAMPYL